MANDSRQAARKFREYWLLAKDSESGGCQKFWISLLGEVLGAENAAYGLKPDTPEPEIVAHLFGLYAKATKGTKETTATGEAKTGSQSLSSLQSLSSIEGGSNG